MHKDNVAHLISFTVVRRVPEEHSGFSAKSSKGTKQLGLLRHTCNLSYSIGQRILPGQISENLSFFEGRGRVCKVCWFETGFYCGPLAHSRPD